MVRKAGLAVLAVLVLAGTAGAASRWVITNIHQIKPSVLKQLRSPAIIHAPQGLQGPQGPPGPSGPPLGVHVYTGTVATLCQFGGGSCASGVSDARCASGPVLGGGWDGSTSPPVAATAAYNQPDADGMGWHVIMTNDTSYVTATFAATAVCASSGASIARAGIPQNVRTQLRRELQAVRARG